MTDTRQAAISIGLCALAIIAALAITLPGVW